MTKKALPVRIVLKEVPIIIRILLLIKTRGPGTEYTVADIEGGQP
jgi:hypothetical protein